MYINFGWPQWVYIAIIITNLLIAANVHGKPRTGNHNFWIALAGVTIGTLVIYAGGFWEAAP